MPRAAVLSGAGGPERLVYDALLARLTALEKSVGEIGVIATAAMTDGRAHVAACIQLSKQTIANQAYAETKQQSIFLKIEQLDGRMWMLVVAGGSQVTMTLMAIIGYLLAHFVFK